MLRVVRGQKYKNGRRAGARNLRAIPKDLHLEICIEGDYQMSTTGIGATDPASSAEASAQAIDQYSEQQAQQQALFTAQHEAAMGWYSAVDSVLQHFPTA
jgi:hypothetical protein